MRYAKRVGAVICFLPLSAAAVDFSLQGVLRSVTGAITSKKEPVKQTGPAATLGIRGMDDGQQIAGAPSSEDYMLIEGWVASANEAANMAKKRELEARRVSVRIASVDAGKDKK